MVDEASPDYGGMDIELITEFVDESKEALNNVTNLFIVLEKNPNDKASIDAVFRAVHSIKGNAAFFGLMKVKSLAHIMEDLMNLIRKGTIIYGKSIASSLIKGIDELQVMLDNARAGRAEIKPSEKEYLDSLLKEIEAHIELSKVPTDVDIWKSIINDINDIKNEIIKFDNPEVEKIFTRLKENINKLSPLKEKTDKEVLTTIVADLKPEASAPPECPTPSEIVQENKAAHAEAASTKTMRIAESTIDKFLDFIGELVVVNEMYEHIHMRLKDELGVGKIVTDFKKNNDIFHSVSQNLQKSLLQIRKVPMKTLLSRAPRIVRDVSMAKNKEISVNIVGDELMIDKSLIEMLDAPFTHMLRNSADHGVETPDIRKKTGKTPAGTVVITVTEDDDTMSISIKDDGKGIDTDAVKAKAISTGLITSEKAAKLTEAEAYQLLFKPGLSTAEKVTDISGRGVGMDVVKRNVEEIGGKILIDSKKGLGSEFIIQFPKSVSVKIINGFFISIHGERFILPMNFVGGSIEIDHNCITTLPDGSQCYNRKGEVFPLIRLSEILGIPPQNGDYGSDTRLGVIIDIDGRRTILFVSEVLGTQQIVIKPIHGLIGIPDIISGAALLGDERLAIVLAIEKMGSMN